MEHPMSENKIFEKALEIATNQDYEAAQTFISNIFGEDSDLNIVKCDKCGEILALVVNLLAKSISGGDKKATLAVYKHIRKHPDHAELIYGYSYGVGLPIGKPLNTALRSVAKKFNLSYMEALDKRIEYLEGKLHGG